MTTFHDNAGTAEAGDTVSDLGPLAWVLDELRKSLDSAVKAFRRFVREVEAARGTDLASVDASQLRMARQQLHQAAGALDMVGHAAPAAMVRAMEAAAQKFVQHPEKCSETTAQTLERASFALIEYLDGVLRGKSMHPVGLFPQFREIQQLAGSDRIHPADLWPVAWRWVDPVLVRATEPVAYSTAVRSRMDQGVLKVIKTGDAHASAELAQISLGLAGGEGARRRPAIFWKLCAAFFEALANGLIPADVYVKRVASRVLLQYASLSKGETEISERLAQDLLFFCAQAQPTGATPALADVRSAYGLSECEPVDYEVRRFGHFDPAVLAQARKRIETAKELWSSLSGGDLARLRNVTDQFNLVGDSLIRLHPASEPLAQALVRAAELTQRGGVPPGAELAMEVATSVLYLEAAFADLDPRDPVFAQRTGRLADRLDRVCAGGSAQALETWMEELYRQVSDRQTMGTVVGELRANLNEVEKALDQYFRSPAERGLVRDVPGLLAQMRGVLSVLGLDQASRAVTRMRADVESILGGEAAESGVSFEKLGNSLGALGFLVDMLGYQPALARKLFVFDEECNELRPLMGRQPSADRDSLAEDESAPESALPASSDILVDQPSLVPALRPEQLDQMAAQAALADQPHLARTAREAAAALQASDAQAAQEALQRLSQVVSAPLEVPVPMEAEPVEEDDLQGIFLDEAREVIAGARDALRILASEPSSLEQMTTLRRAFHTLKGSARMVGLPEFGEAAWAMEQMFNVWLSESKPANEDFRSLSQDALDRFALWVDDIAASADAGWRAEPFRLAAEAMRNENRRISLERSAPFASASDIELLLPDAAAVEPVRAEPAEPEAPTGFGFDLDQVESIEVGSSLFHRIEPAPSALAEFHPELAGSLGQPPIPQAVTATESEPANDLTSEAELTGLLQPEPVLEPEFQAPTEREPLAASESETLPEFFELDGFDLDSLESVPAATLAEADPTAVDASAVDEEPQAHEGLSPEIDERLVEAGLVSEAAEPFSGEHKQDVLAEPDDEQTRLIGGLRIGIPLYNVYLNEADEWSRRLTVELGEWALELDQPLPSSAEGLAHSLAGSSATVGFTALSELARSLEHALQRLHLQSQGMPDQARVLVVAAEEIRRLLHQFAAGFLKEPQGTILEELRQLQPRVTDEPELALNAVEPATLEAVPEPETDTAVESDAESEGFSALIPLGSSEVQAEFLASSFASPIDLAPKPRSDHLSFDTTATGPEFGRLGAHAEDDEIDAVDAIDPDLFPIFEEEAAELLPQLGGALRQWAARPDNAGARVEVLRALHTLKGSARLAGALRLGERAHRMESEIEALRGESLVSAAIEPLLMRLDTLEASFETLKRSATADDTVPLVPQSEPSDSSAPVESDVGLPQEAGMSAAEPVRHPIALPAAMAMAPLRASANQAVRVRSQLLDRLVNQAGEVIITRSRLEAELSQLRGSLQDLTGNLDRLRQQLRDIEVQAESQMQSRMAQAKDSQQSFDPLEFDRFTRVQELTRMMAESVNDVATVQRNLQRAIDATEDDLAAQARQTRELQRDLLRTRMVEFEGISERLYRVVRQAAKDTGKQVRLDITGGSIEMDRGVLDRMTPAFEHLLRNCVAHGIEDPVVRAQVGKESAGSIRIDLRQEGNDVSVSFQDDGAGLDLDRIRARAQQQGLVAPGQALSDAEATQLIYTPGFSTVAEVSELAGRGIGMDVVRAEVQSLGGRIETTTEAGRGTTFRLVLPLTTAVTQVVMMRAGGSTIGVPSNVVEVVRRATARDLQQAYNSGVLEVGGESIPFFWLGSLLQSSGRSFEPQGKTLPVVIFRSAAQRVAVHVDEVLGNQEVVVKNLGPQLSRLPGLAGMTMLASGAVVLIYNPVALAAVYGEQARRFSADQAQPDMLEQKVEGSGGELAPVAAATQVPLVLVVDDSITVRRVTQRLLQREGYRVALAADGLQALERLQDERPAVVLSDIEMPRMDGFDLLRNIRADLRLHELPVIMITSRIAEKHREHAVELGVNHYLGKPYSEEELLSLVRRYARAEVPV